MNTNLKSLILDEKLGFQKSSKDIYLCFDEVVENYNLIAKSIYKNLDSPDVDFNISAYTFNATATSMMNAKFFNNQD
eukprot:gene8916-865_t